MSYPVEARIVNGPWNDMILMTDAYESRVICMYLEAVIEAQNETNRLLAIIANKGS